MNKLFRTGAVFFGVLVTSAISLSILMAESSSQYAEYSADLNPQQNRTMRNANYQYNRSPGVNYTRSAGVSSDQDTTVQSSNSQSADTCTLPQTIVTDEEFTDCCPKECCPETLCCSVTPCCDCWNLYCHDEKVYYNEERCIQIDIPCRKKCCRCVPVYYNQCCVRYVPKAYTKCINYCEREYCNENDTTASNGCSTDICQTDCRLPCPPCFKYTNKTCEVECIGYFPEYYNCQRCRNQYEYYYVFVNRPCYQKVCEPRCQIFRKYRWERICNNPTCCTPCPTDCPQPQVIQS